MAIARILSLAAICLMLNACSSALNWAPQTHVVKSGETVYSIAFQYGIDQRELIGWNRLSPNGLIFAGQKLRLTAPDGYVAQRSSAPTAQRRPPARSSGSGSSRSGSSPSRPSTTSVKWRWPTQGSVIAGFGATAKTQSGVHIGGKRGQSIVAAARGEVVYAGSGLPGYGQLLIIKHTSDYLSAYGHNQTLLVGEGDKVQSGQVIARMGEGPGQRPLLHFEIRRGGQPANPLGYLPKR